MSCACACFACFVALGVCSECCLPLTHPCTRLVAAKRRQQVGCNGCGQLAREAMPAAAVLLDRPKALAEAAEANKIVVSPHVPSCGCVCWLVCGTPSHGRYCQSRDE